MVGLPGAGKSTLLAALAERLEWALVDRDAIRAAMFQPCDFTVEEKDAATLAARAALTTHLRLGRSALLDGLTLARRQSRDTWLAAVARTGAESRMLWLDTPLELASARVHAGAGHPAGDRTGALVEEIAARFEPPVGVTRLDGTRPAAELVDLSLGILQGR